MKKNTWNIIYFIGFMLPLAVWMLSNITFDVGGTLYHLFNGSSAVASVISNYSYLMPCTNLVALLCDGEIASVLSNLGGFGFMVVGCDLVLWLSCIHLVLDLFMLLTNFVHNCFEKVGSK